MAKQKHPITQAVRILRDAGVNFDHHLYSYEEKGGTTHSAQSLGVDEHTVIKTLIFEDEQKKPLIMLMHGDNEVSTKTLAREIGVKSITPCLPAVAQKHSGYQVGGTSPFGTKKSIPVYCEETILALPNIYINGGKRGYLISLSPSELNRVLEPVLVNAVQ